MLLINGRIKCVGMLGVFGLLSGAAFAGGPGSPKKDGPVPLQQAQERLNRASNRFIQNAGQWPDKADFLARSQNLNVWLTNKGVTFDYFRERPTGKNPTKKGQVVSMSFEGANNVKPVGEDKVSFVTDYITTSRMLHKKTAQSFKGAVAHDIYPGINFHAYYDDTKPRYDFVVAPNANPGAIKLGFHGADHSKISNNAIALDTQIGTLLQGKLFAYQQIGGKKVQVPASFVALGKDTFGFKLGAYDHSKKLVIDPLVYGTYYGGDGGWDEVRSVVTDNAGGVYLTGYTMAPDFPAIDGPYGFTIHGGKDAFVTKLQGDAFSHDYAAFIAGSLDDYAQFIKVDPFGDIWIAGQTQSSDFPGNEVYQRPDIQFVSQTSQAPQNAPATGGTFTMNYGGLVTTKPLPFNATTQQVANALNDALGLPETSPIPEGPGQTIVYVDAAPSTLDQGVTYRIGLPWNFPLLITVDSSGMDARYRLQQRPNGQAVEIAANGTVSGGTYGLIISIPGQTPFEFPTVPYNATPAQLEAGINAAVTSFIGVDKGPSKQYCHVVSETPGNTTLPCVIEWFDALSTNIPKVSIDPTLLTGGGILQVNSCTRYALSVNPNGSFPTGGQVGLIVSFISESFANWNSTNAGIRTALFANALVGANNVVTDVDPYLGPGGGAIPTDVVTITFCGTLANQFVPLQVDNSNLLPQPVYSFSTHETNPFVMRFQQSATTVLDPVTVEAVRFFGLDGSPTLGGFGIMGNSNPLPTDPVVFAFGGSLIQLAPELPNFPGGQNGYIEKYTYDRNVHNFTQDAAIPRYVSGGSGLDLTGLAIDVQGSVYTGGTCHFNGNVDTSVVPGVFTTTAGVFAGGRLLRNDDLFVQKYLPTGALAYSALIGGNDFDEAGGEDFDVDGTTYNSGSCICVDNNLNLYITGVSDSFNFPRTRGVYGEVFTNSPIVTVTKVNPDCSQILFSTNLQTAGEVLPSGVAVDLRGDTFITGNVHADWLIFPDTFSGPANAGNPNEPTSQPLGTIQVTTQGVNGGLETALVGTNLQPTAGGNDLFSVKGFLNILNTSATTLYYGTYLGGNLDTRCYGPYVDSFGDCWVYGRVENIRSYGLQSSSGAITQFNDTAGNEGLPAAMLSANAFKPTGDGHGPQQTQSGYGILNFTYPPYIAYSWPITSTPPGFPLPYITITSQRDGWVDKLRIGLASVSSNSLSPSTIPGGLGASSTGTVTLTQPAPAGGALVTLTLDSTANASFSPTQPNGSTTITIPAGGTTATYTVFSNPVTNNSTAQITANYEGSFSIALLTVVPWLQQLSLTPTSVVGGNAVTGRITIAATPPTGSSGVTVNVLTDSPAIVSFPAGNTVTVPLGQTSVNFTINTAGVGTVSFPQITASLLGVGVTQTLTVTLANLATLTFNPTTVAGGTISVGTLALDGQATGPFVVNLTSSDPTFTFNTGNTPNNQLVFNQGDTAHSFNVITPYEPANTQTVITATRPAQMNYPVESVSGTLFVKAADLTTFTIAPTEVAGGANSIGTVIVNSAAPTGGVVINLSSSNTTVATVPVTATIPAGATSVVFTISTSVIGATSTSTITASRGPKSLSQVLTVDGVSFALTLNPNSVVGGPQGTSTGTITLPAVAPAGGLNFTIHSSDYTEALFGAGAGDIVVTVQSNQKTANFPIFTNAVSLSGTIAAETATISATITPGGTLGGNGSVSQTLTILPVGVQSITFVPSVVSQRSPRNRTVCMITLNGPCPIDGVITLTSSVPGILNVPATVPVSKGQTSVTPFVIVANANSASRTLTTIVTASLNGGTTAAASVTVTR